MIRYCRVDLGAWPKRIVPWIASFLIVLSNLWSALAAPDYATAVRPLFERSCYGCHGPAKQKGGFRLDLRDVALKGGSSGNAAIRPHDAKNSPLILYVSGQVAGKQMPPPSSGIAPLTASEIELLTAWIDAGPSWPDEFAGETKPKPDHWSLKPLIRPEVPGPEDNPIDAFVHARLNSMGLLPSTEADRRTLIRRVYYDLIGLPPTPEVVDAFVSDPDPHAYEDLVDGLLASPRYGERWARHWLDTIHFADSHGYEHDIARENAWRYRDYVIAALNNDTSWARFIREQLAADYFYPGEPQLTAALGFLGAGTFDFSTYSTAPVTFDYLDRDDLVTQTMAAFVSTTANCARCHAHKFDPISQEDYYALQADFAGILKGDVSYDEDPAVARERMHWNEVLSAADRRDAAALLTSENEAYIRTWINARGNGAAWTPLNLDTFSSTEGATLIRRADGVILSNGNLPEKDTYVVTASSPLKAITAIRLDVFTDDSLPMKGPGRRENGNFHLSEFQVHVFDEQASKPEEVQLQRATADFNQIDWTIDRALDGDTATAWGIDPQEGSPHYAVFELAKPLSLSPNAHISITLKQLHGRGHLIGAFGLSVTSDPPERAAALPSSVEATLALSSTERTQEQQATIAAVAMRAVAQSALEKLPSPVRVYAAAKSVEIPAGEPRPKLASIPKPKTVNLMERGEFDKPRDAVGPGALSALHHLPARFAINDPDNEAERRAALADWIAHPENVLTWRSVVNRVWHYHFGRGICDTPSDFGEMGGTPSHPDMIDWLAVWFRDNARGSLKQLHRLIVTSETYKQSSQQRADAAHIDGDNRFLWRQFRQRLDADAYRDFTLAISGHLDLTMGGSGIKQFTQTKGPQLTPALDYRAYDWSAPGSGRRSIYRFVWRGIADPFMESLDFPDLGLLSPARGFSASPLQALALYNNDFVLHESAMFAHRVEREATDLEASVRRAVRLVWLRDPNETEFAAFSEFAKNYGLSALCRVLLNSNEFLFVE